MDHRICVSRDVRPRCHLRGLHAVGGTELVEVARQWGGGVMEAGDVATGRGNGVRSGHAGRDLRGEAPGDPVAHPSHYTQGGIETIDFIEAKALGFHLGNVVKYVTRAAHKGSELQDLRKARWYLDRWIELRERES